MDHRTTRNLGSQRFRNQMLGLSMPVLAGAAAVAGCLGTGHMVGPAMGHSPGVLAVSPSDGSRSVAVDAPVVLAFSVAMDTASVNSSVFFIAGDATHEWMDPLNRSEGCETAMSRMVETMKWMHSIAIPGRVRWNAGMDTCMFIPGQAIAPETDCMFMLSGSARSREGNPMDMSLMPHGVYMTHFTTAP